jgi:large subunit ribosomal protein L25
MAKEISLKVSKRKITGRKVKTLRNQGLLPGNVYGKKVSSLAVEINGEEFKKVYKEAGETNLVKLVIEGEKNTRSVLISNLQKDSVLDVPFHVDFHQVDLTEKVTVSIPVVVVGESPAVKEKGGVLITLLDEIRVEALPVDLPDEFKVDVTNLKEINNSILVKDLQVDTKKVKFEVQMDEVVVTVKEPTEEEVTTETAPVVEGIEPAAEVAKKEEVDDKTTKNDKLEAEKITS